MNILVKQKNRLYNYMLYYMKLGIFIDKNKEKEAEKLITYLTND